MNTKAIRKMYSLTQREFAEKFEIPFGTIQNWDARDCMPDWAGKLIYNYLLLEIQLEHEKEFSGRLAKAFSYKSLNDKEIMIDGQTENEYMEPYRTQDPWRDPWEDEK